jgi:hypothetical protein
MPDLEIVLMFVLGGAACWALAKGLESLLGRRDPKPAAATPGMAYAPRVYVTSGDGAQWLTEAATQRIPRYRPAPGPRRREPETVRFERAA